MLRIFTPLNSNVIFLEFEDRVLKILIFGLCLFINSEIASAASCAVFSEEQKVALSEEYRSSVKFERQRRRHPWRRPGDRRDA